MTIVRWRGPRGIGDVPKGLSEELRAFLERLKIAVDATLDGTVAKAQIANKTIAAGGGDGTGGSSETDLTPPPSPFDVVVAAGVDYVGVITGNPTFTTGNGYDRTIVYGAKYPGTGPLPTFASAAVVHEFRGEVGSFATEPAQQWHIWVSWRSRDGVTSTAVVGGVNGFIVTTGQVTDAMVAEVNASKIRTGSLSVGQWIQSSGFVPLTTAGFLINGNGEIEARTVGGARIFHLNASGAQPVLKIDSVFQITGAGALTMSGALTASTFTGGTITGSVIQTAATGKRVTINEGGNNEARFYGDRGDGTVEELAAIGINSVGGGDFVIGQFGTNQSSRNAIRANANNTTAIVAYSNTGFEALYASIGASAPSSSASIYGNSILTAGATGVFGRANGGVGVAGVSATGIGVYGISTSGHGGFFTGNATCSAVFLTPVTAAPSNTTLGGLAIIRNPTSLLYNLCKAQSGSWVTVDGSVAWNDPGDTSGGV